MVERQDIARRAVAAFQLGKAEARVEAAHQLVLRRSNVLADQPARAERARCAARSARIASSTLRPSTRQDISHKAMVASEPVRATAATLMMPLSPNLSLSR